MSTVIKFGTGFFPVFVVFVLSLLLASCGTINRTGKVQKEPVPPPEIKSVSPAEPVSVEFETPDSSLARVLITPEDEDAKIVELVEKGRASWYGPNFHGRLTANGEQFDMNAMTAAHRTLPFNTVVLVQNEDSDKVVLVRINDRGPYAKDRIIDLSKAAAGHLGMIGSGTAHVKLYIGKNVLEKSESTNLSVPTYTIQLGSFDTEAKAFSHSSKIKGSRVEVVRKANKTYYRVYFGLYIDRTKARQKQRELEQQNYSGYVKQLENG